jgi:hypothetical protein
MRRQMSGVCRAMVAVGLTIGVVACGSETSTESRDEGDEAVVDAATDEDATTDGADASTDEPTGDDDGDGGDPAADISVADTFPNVDTSANPTIAALVSLPTEQVCALLPEDAVESITGVSVSAGDGMIIEGLGTNCLYYADNGDGLDLIGKLEFDVLNWADTKSLAEFTVDDSPTAESCSVGGREALCTPAYEIDGLTISAYVSVKLGGDADGTLSTYSDLGVEQALAMAEVALGNLAL